MTSRTTDLSGLIIPQTFTTQSYFKQQGNPIEVGEITLVPEAQDVKLSESLLAGKARLPPRPSETQSEHQPQRWVPGILFTCFKGKAKIRSDVSMRHVGL